MKKSGVPFEFRINQATYPTSSFIEQFRYWFLDNEIEIAMVIFLLLFIAMIFGISGYLFS